MKVRVNPTKCNGYGRCADVCPEVFQLDEWNQAMVVAEYAEEVPAKLQERAQAASKACPEHAIDVEHAES